jgi:adenylosuccinate synthase
MLLDVLGGLDEIKICTAYEIDGKRTSQFPSHADDLKKAVPVYEMLPGWQEDISTVQTEAELPATARRYLARIGELLGRPVTIVSVGPDRDQTIICHRPATAAAPWPSPPQPVPANA